MASDVRLLDRPFNPAAEVTAFGSSHLGLGGICTFIGEVRSEGGVKALELSHYAPLTLPGMQALAANAVTRFGLMGLLLPGRLHTAVESAGKRLLSLARTSESREW